MSDVVYMKLEKLRYSMICNSLKHFGSVEFDVDKNHKIILNKTRLKPNDNGMCAEHPIDIDKAQKRTKKALFWGNAFFDSLTTK